MKKKLHFLTALALLLMTTTACGQEDKKESSSQTPVGVSNVSMTEQPLEDANPAITSIEFAEKSFNFGEKKITDDFTHTFTFTNTGDQDLVIEAAKASCSCTVSEYTKGAIQPGETGTISARFNPKEGFSGAFKKTVTVTANTEPRNVVLEIGGEVVN